jgi:hypothetical protein
VRYAQGDGVEVDDTEALAWFHRAADAGLPQAAEAFRSIAERVLNGYAALGAFPSDILRRFGIVRRGTSLVAIDDAITYNEDNNDVDISNLEELNNGHMTDGDTQQSPNTLFNMLPTFDNSDEFATYILYTTNSHVVPVPIARIANEFHIKLFDVKFHASNDPASQLILDADNTLKIYLANDLSIYWRRFHIAQHLCQALVTLHVATIRLPENITPSDRSFSSVRKGFAARFARSILLPKDLFG